MLILGVGTFSCNFHKFSSSVFRGIAMPLPSRFVRIHLNHPPPPPLTEINLHYCERRGARAWVTRNQPAPKVNTIPPKIRLICKKLIIKTQIWRLAMLPRSLLNRPAETYFCASNRASNWNVRNLHQLKGIFKRNKASILWAKSPNGFLSKLVSDLNCPPGQPFVRHPI